MTRNGRRIQRRHRKNSKKRMFASILEARSITALNEKNWFCRWIRLKTRILKIK